MLLVALPACRAQATPVSRVHNQECTSESTTLVSPCPLEPDQEVLFYSISKGVHVGVWDAYCFSDPEGSVFEIPEADLIGVLFDLHCPVILQLHHVLVGI